jgi:hypothetical protein
MGEVRYFLRCDVCGLETYNEGSPQDDEGNNFRCLCMSGVLKPTGKKHTILR